MIVTKELLSEEDIIANVAAFDEGRLCTVYEIWKDILEAICKEIAGTFVYGCAT